MTELCLSVAAMDLVIESLWEPLLPLLITAQVLNGWCEEEVVQVPDWVVLSLYCQFLNVEGLQLVRELVLILHDPVVLLNSCLKLFLSGLRIESGSIL